MNWKAPPPFSPFMPRGKPAPQPKALGKGKAITSLEDLAAHVGVSTWTVSRAINGHPEVSEATRQRILAAMESAGFRPNPMARALRGRNDLIGVCFSDIENPMHTKKLYHLQEFLKPRRLRTFFQLSAQDPQNELRVIADFVSIRVDGIVLVYSTLSTSIRELLKGTACIFVDPHTPQELPSIAVDRRDAMRMLFEHLYRMDHREFVLFGFNQTNPWRWQALAEAAQDRGLDPHKVFRSVEMPVAPSQIRAGRIMAEAVLKWPQRPRAVIAIDDRVALGAIQGFKDAGVEVPREISVTGFDNLDFARNLHPTITTIEQNPLRLMERAGEMLVAEMALPPEKRGDALHEKVPAELVVGESTGPAWRGP